MNRRKLLLSSLALLGSAALSGGGAVYALNATGVAPKPPAPPEPPSPGAPNVDHSRAKDSLTPAPAGRSDAPAAPGPHWDYQDATGPEAWGDLDPSFVLCKVGGSQSPLDLTGALRVSALTSLNTEYAATRVRVANNGHTFQVAVDRGSSLTINGKRFDLQQFHFHTPSEHTIDGRSFPLELHLVHQAVDRSLAVIGVLMTEGLTNTTLARFWDRLPRTPAEVDTGVVLDLKDLLPRNTDEYFTYAGSLTTPPCSESVRWIVLQQPLQVSRNQVATFRAVFPMNARPVTPLGARTILSS